MANFTPQEIEQFLQEFFDVVGARQYVGARYVPIFGRAGEDTVEWDNLAPYEPLTVVMHEGVSYVSRRYVPKGIQITDTAYWVETYRFNAQVEQYRREVMGFQGQIDNLRNDLESDYIPFPDSYQYPKYGTLGQVLATLANGETKWDDPVTVDAAIAGPLIDAWLEDHPDATTTVQDGSITDAKINTSASILRTRGNNTLTNNDFNNAENGFYAITNTSNTSYSNIPVNKDGILLSYIATSIVKAQIYIAQRTGNNTDIYYRRYFGNTLQWNAWCRVIDTETFMDMLINGANSIPNNDLNDATTGFWSISNQSSVTYQHLPANEGGILFCYYGSTDTAVQVYVTYESGNVSNTYIRRYFGSSAQWSNWKKLLFESDLIKGNDNITTHDLNDATLGFWGITTTTYQNLPVNRPGILFCYNCSSDVKAQLYITHDNPNTFRMYVRRYYGHTLQWSDWQRVITDSSFMDMLINGANSIPNNDLNDATTGFWSISNQSSVTYQHLPANEGGILFCYYGSTDTAVQVYVTYESGNVSNTYIRRYYGSSAQWNDWQLLYTNAKSYELKEYVHNTEENILAAFDNILCCGDSLTLGAINRTENTYAKAKRPYPYVLGNILGTTMTVLAQGGLTASTWWAAYESNITTKTNALAIVYLGTNGGLTDTLNTDAPENTSRDTWADTNTGCYAKIVDKLQEEGYKVLLVNIYTNISATTRSVIRQIANRFSCGLIDDNVRFDDEYRTYLDIAGSDATHYNALGYSKFAYYLNWKANTMGEQYIRNIIPTDVDSI